jgi:hypothetical protein
LYLDGLSFHWHQLQLETLLRREGIEFTKVLRKSKNPHAVVYLDNAADRRAAYEDLAHHGLGKRPVTVVALQRDYDVIECQTRRLRARMSSDIATRSINGRVAPWVAVR